MQLPSTWSWSTWWWRSSTWPSRRSSLNPRRTRTSLRSWSTSKDQPENWLDWSKFNLYSFPKIYLFLKPGPLFESYQSTKRTLERRTMPVEAKRTILRRNHFRTNSRRRRTSCWTTLRRPTSRASSSRILRARTSLKRWSWTTHKRWLFLCKNMILHSSYAFIVYRRRLWRLGSTTSLARDQPHRTVLWLEKGICNR